MFARFPAVDNPHSDHVLLTFFQEYSVNYLLGKFGILCVNYTGNPDLAGGNHLDVDVLISQDPEHFGGNPVG